MKVDDNTLLTMCLSGSSQAQIAETLGMTKAQICRRVNNPDFQIVLAEYRKKVLDAVLTDLTANAQKSVQTLVELLDCDIPSIQLQAASKILTLSQDYSLQHDILRDIDALKTSSKETIYNEQQESIIKESSLA